MSTWSPCSDRPRHAGASCVRSSSGWTTGSWRTPSGVRSRPRFAVSGTRQRLPRRGHGAGDAVGDEAERQRARRDRIENRSRRALERDRRAELLLVQALNALAERDAATARCEASAGRVLIDATALGLSTVVIAARSGLRLAEVRRLVCLARDQTGGGGQLDNSPPNGGGRR